MASDFLTETEIRLSDSVVVRVGAEADADVIFLPIDAGSSLGRLSGEILEKFRLGPASLPPTDGLGNGYYIQPVDHKGNHLLICFIVTVGQGDTGRALERHLRAALADDQIHARTRSMWIPLMGTGAGRLAFEDSFQIIIDVLRASKWYERRGVRIVIAPPANIDLVSRDALSFAIDQVRGVPPDRLSEVPHSVTDGAYEIERDPAVTAALQLAAALGPLRKSAGKQISTTTLFFALAESQSAAASPALGADQSAQCFSAAVHHVLGDKYDSFWQSNFATEHPLRELSLRPLARPTRNVDAVLRAAFDASRKTGGTAIDIDHLVDALLTFEKAHVLGRLSSLGIDPEELLREYHDAMLGQVAMTLFNDVADAKDRLGYESYAIAISEFLTHPGTTPPLSISIQAPWGAGKSSLMKIIREKLDPADIRDQHKPKVEQARPHDRSIRGALRRLLNGVSSLKKQDEPVKTARERLSLGSVLRLLNEVGGFEIFAKPDGARRWTVWFNVWKYENSEQVWAGLVDSIVSQISERLPIVEREKFLLKLHLARIDDGVVRRKIYDRIVTVWWEKVRAWAIAAGAALLSLFGIGVAAPDRLSWFNNAIPIWAGSDFGGMFASQTILSIVLAGSYVLSRSKTRAEPATYSLAEYIQVPDYTKSVGAIHQIHDDLRKVLAVVPSRGGNKTPSPIVIFIDDLDRCSPGKVASVVEGVSMLLASDIFRCMFVIGMDPQMIAAALEKAHEDVRNLLPSYERTVPLGWRFMDKFIQLPFTIPPSNRERLKDYVESLGTGSATPELEPTQVVSQGASLATSTTVTMDDANLLAEEGSLHAMARTDDSDDQLILRPRSDITERDFLESKDVGRIIREVANYASGNPRELKRMVNLARLYLSLRNARRLIKPPWKSPDLDQYARWIALTLRWPDMMRWLQWGADEATWPASDTSIELVVRRLRVLEAIADRAPSGEAWCGELATELRVKAQAESDWPNDGKLFEFLKEEGQKNAQNRLSTAAHRGFW